MIRTICHAAAFSAAMTLTATADVEVTISSDGYDDFFNRCDLAFEHTGHDGDIWVTYRIVAGDKGAAICQDKRNTFGCREADDLEYTCEDITRFDVFDVTCIEGDTTADCGAVTVIPGDGLPVPPIPYPGLGSSSKGVKVFGTVLGYDDFFEDCEMGFSYAADPSIDQVEIRYDIAAAGGESSCTTTLSSHSGTGRGCNGGLDYTCDQVEQVSITEITCESDDVEVDCSDATFGTFDALMKDAR